MDHNDASLNIPGEDEDEDEELDRLAGLEERYEDLLAYCADECRDGEVLLEALHMMHEWPDEFRWVDLDEAAGLIDVLSRRMNTTRKAGAPSATALLRELGDIAESRTSDTESLPG